MTEAEIFAIYGAPWMLVIGAALMAWRNHVVMERARARDRTETASASGNSAPARRPFSSYDEMVRRAKAASGPVSIPVLLPKGSGRSAPPPPGLIVPEKP